MKLAIVNAVVLAIAHVWVGFALADGARTDADADADDADTSHQAVRSITTYGLLRVQGVAAAYSRQISIPVHFLFPSLTTPCALSLA